MTIAKSIWYSQHMREKKRLQLALEPETLDRWTEEARRLGVPVSTWVTLQVNRPECDLDTRMDRLIEVLDTLAHTIARK